MFHDQSQQADIFRTLTSKRETGMTCSLSSWVTARKVAGMDAHSQPKRRVSEPVSSKQSSLGDTAVAAKAARQIQSRQAT